MLAAALLVLLAFVPDSAGQCPPSQQPLSHAPIVSLDAQTSVLGQFDGTVAMQMSSGASLLESGLELDPLGLFGTQAGRMPVGPAVAIYELPLFNKKRGTIEMWIKPGLGIDERQVLFSLAGVRSVDGDRYNDLFVGEALLGPGPVLSPLYLNSGNGLDLGRPALFETWMPRGVAFGDVDGDGIYDLAVAMNQADTLPAPLTPSVPGEVHVFRGPFQKDVVHQPQWVFEADEPQGMVMADFDQDGDQDLLTASYSSFTPAVLGWENDGLGNFTLMDFPFPEIIATAEALSAGDVNKDGVLDVMYSSFGFPPSRVLIGEIGPSGYTFQDVQTTSSDRSNGALGNSLGDLDGDGWLDAVLAQPLFDNGSGEVPGRVAIHLNNGDGTFDTVPDCSIVTERPFTVSAVRDVDNDGHLDIVVANWRDGADDSPASTVLRGPFPGSCDPDRVYYEVQSAVAMTMGDLDDDGIQDLFLRSSTADESRLFFLDENGASQAGLDADSEYQPDLLIATSPTSSSLNGEGVGVFAAVAGGTQPYGTVHDRSNSFELYVENAALHFEITDSLGVTRGVSAPLPGLGHPDSVGGFHHVQAEWAVNTGLMELRVGHPGKAENVFAETHGAFSVSHVSKLFRLGSDPDNQQRAKGWSFDDVRVSSVRRSQNDQDGDNVLDEWDNCPAVSNSLQADADADGIGDACAVCQPDLGSAGPGTLALTVCGEELLSCNSSTLTVSGAPSFTEGILSVSLSSDPFPVFGGTLLASPILIIVPLQFDQLGAFQVQVPGGGGPGDVYVQALALDGAQPQGVAISNAVLVQFGP